MRHDQHYCVPLLVYSFVRHRNYFVKLFLLMISQMTVSFLIEMNFQLIRIFCIFNFQLWEWIMTDNCDSGEAAVGGSL